MHPARSGRRVRVLCLIATILLSGIVLGVPRAAAQCTPLRWGPIYFGECVPCQTIVPLADGFVRLEACRGYHWPCYAIWAGAGVDLPTGIFTEVDSEVAAWYWGCPAGYEVDTLNAFVEWRGQNGCEINVYTAAGSAHPVCLVAPPSPPV